MDRGLRLYSTLKHSKQHMRYVPNCSPSPPDVDLCQGQFLDGVRPKQQGGQHQRSARTERLAKGYWTLGRQNRPRKRSADVKVRHRLQRLGVEPGWSLASAYLVNDIDHDQFRLPMLIDMVYVGCGFPEIFLRPSPWCNPVAYFTEDEQEANWIFALVEQAQDVLPRLCVHTSSESTRGATVDEGCECSATSSGNSTLNSSVASNRDVSYWNRVQPASPESWTALSGNTVISMSLLFGYVIM